MKRKMTVCFTAMLAALVLASAAALAAPVSAQLTKLKGDVKVKASASASWTAASEGMKVSEGASVKTGADSEVFAAWKNNVVKIGPLSSVTMETLLEDADGNATSKVNITEGKVFSKVTSLKKGSQFTIKTPTAIAGVRGTGFEAGIGRFSIVEGTVAVSAGGVEVEVQPGLMVEISSDGTPGEPVAIPAILLQELKATNEQCGQIISEIMKGEGAQGKGKGGEEKETAAEETTAAETSAASATGATDSVLNTTTNVLTTTEQSASPTFLPGTGGVQGTIDLPY